MGLLSDTFEDNRERSGQIEMREYVPIELPPAPPPQVCCPVCDREFGSDLALDNHIKKDHGREHVYIKANGYIVRRTEVLAKGLRQCELIPLGLESLTVTIHVDGKSKRLTANGRMNLLDYLPSDYKGEVQVTAGYGNMEQNFLMYVGAEPPFDTPRLNKVVNELQRCLDRGMEPDWNGVQAQQRKIARNELEKKYLDGFFEYSLGFYLDKQERSGEGGQHLETAMQLLQPYSTPLGRTAKRVLAIRMNCFTPLERCQQGSVFWPARAFFIENALELPESLDGSSATGENSVYIDKFTELLLMGIKTFYCRDPHSLSATIKALSAHPLAADRNNEDKLLLMRGRAARIQGDQVATQRAYERLLYHPMFGLEAEEMIKNHE